MSLKTALQRVAFYGMALGLALSSPLQAAEKETTKKEPQVSWVRMELDKKQEAVDKLKEAPYSKKGVDTCVSCHDEENEAPVFPIFKTKHAVKADARTPFGHENKQCESCHGAGGEHVKAKKTEKRAGNIISFGKNAWTPGKDQNKKCQTCLQSQQRIACQGSSH